MSADGINQLHEILERYRDTALTQRESGTYFEDLTVCYLKNEPAYRELYREVLPFAEWARREGLDKRDTGIDLVAVTFTNEVHAIQCKLYASDYRLQKADIDSFFTASGKRPFTHRIIVSTTDHWTEHAEEALRDQRTPVTKIDLRALENSVLDWGQFAPRDPPVLKQKKQLRPHQREAITRVRSGLETRERGKLIMACGTGKTFTSLKLVEDLAGQGKAVLFLVPSLALLSQTLTEWTQESQTRLRSFAVCSDSDVGKRRKQDDDVVQTFVHELSYPATTDPKSLAIKMEEGHGAEHMSVVFATYHSIDVVHRAQHEYGLPAFDVIVCDEAHRTTGSTFDGEDESHFVRVHDANYVRGARRLYMTATPRIFGDFAKATAERDKIELYSMDDEALYGPYLHILTFSEAVKRGLLVDYKVIVLTVDAKHVSARIQGLLKDENNELRVDDAAKIVGCWKALAKQGLIGEANDGPMRRAVAFCQVIERPKGAKVHKVASKQIASMFQAVVEAYQENEPADEGAALRCEAEHVDGSMNASEKQALIDWLKAETAETTCRILSNVRCLSEGVDVPALDAVLFLTPRNSQVDVVQSVGRVMRNAPGKKRGYIVLPVVIPTGMEPDQALHDNQTYKVVWQVLQALRSHDDRFDAMVNKLDLIGRDPSKLEVIAVADKIAKRPRKEADKEAARRVARSGRSIGGRKMLPTSPLQTELQFEIGEIERAIYARLVEKVGNRRHWEDWAKDIATIARTHIDRITAILDDSNNTREREAFDRFADELRDDLNDSITRDDIIEMLAQHLVTKPVFEALFTGTSFVTENAMSRAMQAVLDLLQEHHLEKEASTLQAFYDSVKLRAEGIDNAEGKQKIVVELYDKFFRNAFPKMSARLGIVYTPVEIVDFILRSVDHLLRAEFGQTLGSEGVHILDPFTGTGTFVTRLLQSGLIEPDELSRKYASEIHANEIVLLAYYIAAINIEAAYHGIVGDAYTPFSGICLTDTFQLYEKDDLVSKMLVDNSARRTRQKKLDIRVIIGNPPYSVGQESQNDNNQNVAYPLLDARIGDTYAARSSATSSKPLYDSYVRAIRWASDRVGANGIIGFVTNASFIEATTADGLRKCLAEEFSSLYIFHLRGNQRTAGERSRREGGKVFGSGSRAPVAISLLVKNPKHVERGVIYFRDVADYLTRDEKLETLAAFGSIAGITRQSGWVRIQPDTHGDWLKQREESFGQYAAMGSKDLNGGTSLFETFSLGVATARDPWVTSPSHRDLCAQIGRLVAAYEAELARFDAAHPGLTKKAREHTMGGFIDMDPTRISWTRGLKTEFAKGTHLTFNVARIVPSLYRPYCRHWLYFERKLNDMVYRIPQLFPRPSSKNRVIGVTSGESRSGFSVIMTDVVPSLHAADMVGSQFFPLYVYDTDEVDGTQTPLLASSAPARRDGITAAGLAHFQAACPDEPLTKEDVFYYVYGLLHSPDYRERFADSLGKELPRIPRVKPADFWAFSRSGRALAELHVGFEHAPEYPARVDGPARATADQYRVTKMKFGKGKDKAIVHYNEFFTVRDIPADAYEYVVNGKSAIEWVMERQIVASDKPTSITRDANAWATETVGDPRYPLSLLLRVITVGLETTKIVRALPALEVLDQATAPEPAQVVPFRRVTPKPGDRFNTCVPLVALSVAAGAWSELQEDIHEIDDPNTEWVTWDDPPRFAKGMFVARVRGRSMEPTVSDGAYCLFRRVSLPSSPERVALVRHGGERDPETGGQFTVKLYREELGATGEKRVVLQPANPAFTRLVVMPSEVNDVQVVAEIVEVLGATRAPS